MLDWLFYRSAYAEVMSRRILARLPKIKEKLKEKSKRDRVHGKEVFDEERWNKYIKLIDDAVEDNSIILVHASMDGLNNIGVDEEKVIELLLSFVERGITVVCTAYPITNLRTEGHRMKVYNPERTPCWTGMLSNRFVCNSMSIRSLVPYNSLAAIGPKAYDMMRDGLKAEYVYGDHTPWKYCVDNHARILFIGTTSLASNTIQTHMLADYMGERWPIDNWYEIYDTPIKINGHIVDHKLKIQNYFWTKYVADYSSTRKLEKEGYLKRFSVAECPFEYVPDAYDMIKYLESECEKGHLTYLIPRKYWKKGWEKNGH